MLIKGPIFILILYESFNRKTIISKQNNKITTVSHCLVFFALINEYLRMNTYF